MINEAGVGKYRKLLRQGVKGTSDKQGIMMQRGASSSLLILTVRTRSHGTHGTFVPCSGALLSSSAI